MNTTISLLWRGGFFCVIGTFYRNNKGERRTNNMINDIINETINDIINEMIRGAYGEAGNRNS